MTTAELISTTGAASEEARELSALHIRRAEVAAEVIEFRNMGDLENNDPYHRSREELSSIDRRIAEVQELVTAAAAVTDDGTVQPFSLVTVMFDRDPDDVETFVLTAAAGNSADEIATCSPLSPLGRALMGCRVEDERTYVLPTGAESTVTVLSIAAGLERRLLESQTAE